MRLADFFQGVAAKRLSSVEAHYDRSNQHEFNGVAPLREMLGTEKLKIPSKFIYFGAEDDILNEEGSCTWYDSRERHPTRTEYRFYFKNNRIMDSAAENDLILFCLKKDRTMLVIVAPAESTADNQLQWLFDISIGPDNQRLIIGPEKRMESDLGLAGRYILNEIGFDPEPETDDASLRQMLDRFHETFPKTAVFSEYARNTLNHVNPLDDPDQALSMWFNQEEKLFKIYERHIVSQRIREGFGEDVDSFVRYSLSVHNRRKSRVGFALENHIEKVFKAHELKFSTQCMTENRKKPDFIFPSCEKYHDKGISDKALIMLGVKTTCKDRWRQVLSEAGRIKKKHLLTLEPSISIHQTEEMKASNLQLVIPHELHETYNKTQRSDIMSISDFIRLVKQNNKTSHSSCS